MGVEVYFIRFVEKKNNTMVETENPRLKRSSRTGLDFQWELHIRHFRNPVFVQQVKVPEWRGRACISWDLCHGILAVLREEPGPSGSGAKGFRTHGRFGRSWGGDNECGGRDRR